METGSSGQLQDGQRNTKKQEDTHTHTPHSNPDRGHGPVTPLPKSPSTIQRLKQGSMYSKIFLCCWTRPQGVLCAEKKNKRGNIYCKLRLDIETVALLVHLPIQSTGSPFGYQSSIITRPPETSQTAMERSL